MIRALARTLVGSRPAYTYEGDFNLMRCGLRGPVLALGLSLGAAAYCDVHAEEARAFVGQADGQGVAMRFVPHPDLVRMIDPARAAAGSSSHAKSAPTAAGTLFSGVKETNPPRTTASKPTASNWPVTLSEARGREAALASVKQDAWPADEIKAARQRCAAILKRIAAVAVAEAPIREGACGDPAPIRLISIGSKPEVVISPPALVNCEMAEALHTWLKTGLQPLARQHLGGPVIKIVKMSDYSCRNAYGRARGRLSEHGRANALDIAGFMTAKGDTTMLLADWGMTQRDIRRQVAAQKAKADAEQKQRLAAEQRGQENARASLRHATITDEAPMTTGALPPSALGVNSGAPAGGIARTSVIDGVGRVTVSIPGGGEANAAGSSPFDPPPSRLGGPKAHSGSKGSLVVTGEHGRTSAVGEIRKQRFLRGAHTSACGIFGTVLGPEANNAHRNHFHVDLAARKSGAFCQ